MYFQIVKTINMRTLYTIMSLSHEVKFAVPRFARLRAVLVLQ